MGMGLNFNLPQVAPNIVQPTNANYYNLQPSQYAGFQQVGNNNVFEKGGKFYEPYTVTKPVTTYGYNRWGTWKPAVGPYGLPYKPNYNQVGQIMGGVTERATPGNLAEGTIYSGSQAFRPYTGSMIPFYNAPAATKTTIPSFLSTPTMNQATGNYGAGRFLNTGNLLGFNFTPAQTTSSPGQSPAI